MDSILRLVFWALSLVCCAAERQYYPHLSASTWEQARNHCQVCYKELVSLTPENAYQLTQNLTSAYWWVGLRKNLSGPLPWSGWSDGEPLCFQNWYLGRPVLAPPTRPVVTVVNSCPSCDCCAAKSSYNKYALDSLQTSTMEPNTVEMTSEMTPEMTSEMTSEMTTEMTSEMTPEVTTANSSGVINGTNGTSPDGGEEEGGYLEDPCVSMLSAGPWFEKRCSELLPFICYEDRFYGDALVTGVDLHNATVSWSAGPGDVSRYRYRLEVRGVFNRTLNHTELSFNLSGLTAGSLYAVQVFPVKCARELNPQNVSFYTKPDVPSNLSVTKVNETSVSLSWTAPAGERDFYYIRVRGQPGQDTPPCPASGEAGGAATPDHVTACTESAVVGGLMPGGLYVFEVSAGVMDRTVEGNAVNITRYTKPGKVSNLRVSSVKNSSVDLEWLPPPGNTSGYRVTASWKIVSNGNTNLSELVRNVTDPRVTVQPVPAGTNLTLTVVTLVPDATEEGQPVTITTLSIPDAVTGLKLTPTADSLAVSWTPPEGGYEAFVVNVTAAHVSIQRTLRASAQNFSNLKAAVKYRVSVWTLVSGLKSSPTSGGVYTLPVPPEAIRVVSINQTHASVEWDPPKAATGVQLTYNVSSVSRFWGDGLTSARVRGGTAHTFGSLRPGSRYEFAVRTVAGDLQSESVRMFRQTDPREVVLTVVMECSSRTPLECEDGPTQDTVLQKLREQFNNTLSNHVFWKLDWRKEEF